MSIRVKNIQTGETMNVSNTFVKDGQIIGRYQFGTRYFNKYGHALTKVGDTEDGQQPILQLAEGWEVVDEKQPRQPKVQQPQPGVQDEIKDEPQPEVVDVQPTDEPQPVVEAQPQAQPQSDDAAQLVGILQRLAGGQVDATQVAAIAEQVCRKVLSEQQPQQVQHVIKVADLPEVKLPQGQDVSPIMEQVLKQVVNDRAIGRFPWLYGPAGSGKSTIASQVADALGIPFYSVSSLQQKYELEGYTDAVGEFVQTAFYKAMSEGGIFCFDEMSTTSGEVQVAFNTAAAQLLYNFPKVGMIKAHPNFHIIACDNTTGRGNDSRYISRYQLDASTLDRYTFIEVAYSDQHDLRMAQGDKDLVRFMRKLRTVLDNSNTTYLATPRASRSIKMQQTIGYDDVDALWLGLCSGWNKQDVRTFASQLTGTGRYFDAFQQVVSRYC